MGLIATAAQAEVWRRATWNGDNGASFRDAEQAEVRRKLQRCQMRHLSMVGGFPVGVRRRAMWAARVWDEESKGK